MYNKSSRSSIVVSRVATWAGKKSILASSCTRNYCIVGCTLYRLQEWGWLHVTSYILHQYHHASDLQRSSAKQAQQHAVGVFVLRCERR